MKDVRAATLVVVGVMAGFFYSNFILDVLLSKQHDWFAVVSELEVPGTPHAGLLRVTDVLCGVLTLVLLPGVHAGLPAGRRRTVAVWMTAVFAVTNALAGIITLPCGSGETCDTTADTLQQLTHDGLSIVSAAALFIGAWAVARDTAERGPRWLNLAAWFTFWVGGVVSSVLFGVFGYADSSSWQTGITQRLQIVIMSGWIICLAVFAAQTVVGASSRVRED